MAENEILNVRGLRASVEDRFDSCAELLYAIRHLNESDEGYRKKQKRKIGLVVGLFVSSLLCILLVSDVTEIFNDEALLQLFG